MSGVSASHLVIFIASIVVAAGVAGTLVTQVDRVSTSITDQSDGIETQIDTDIQIISDAGNPESIYDTQTDNLTIYIKNTGESELYLGQDTIDVLIEGQFTEPTEIVRTDNEEMDSWPPGTAVEVTVESVALDGDTRVTVVVNENSDTIRFKT